MSDHITRARDYIAKGEEFYAKAADEIIAAKAADPQLSNYSIGERLAKNESWVRRLVTWRTNASAADAVTPFAREEGDAERKDAEATRRMLREPEHRRQVIASLPADQVEEVIATAQDVAVERVRAQRAEHDVAQKAPTAGELMGGDRWDPSESWADTLLIRCNRNLRELGAHVQKWGFVLGSMPIEDAYQYIEQTERIAAEVRAAVQEQLRDRAGV